MDEREERGQPNKRRVDIDFVFNGHFAVENEVSVPFDSPKDTVAIGDTVTIPIFRRSKTEMRFLKAFRKTSAFAHPKLARGIDADTLESTREKVSQFLGLNKYFDNTAHEEATETILNEIILIDPPVNSDERIPLPDEAKPRKCFDTTTLIGTKISIEKAFLFTDAETPGNNLNDRWIDTELKWKAYIGGIPRPESAAITQTLLWLTYQLELDSTDVPDKEMLDDIKQKACLKIWQTAQIRRFVEHFPISTLQVMMDILESDSSWEMKNLAAAGFWSMFPVACARKAMCDHSIFQRLVGLVTRAEVSEFDTGDNRVLLERILGAIAVATVDKKCRTTILKSDPKLSYMGNLIMSCPRVHASHGDSTLSRRRLASILMANMLIRDRHLLSHSYSDDLFTYVATMSSDTDKVIIDAGLAVVKTLADRNGLSSCSFHNAEAMMKNAVDQMESNLKDQINTIQKPNSVQILAASAQAVWSILVFMKNQDYIPKIDTSVVASLIASYRMVCASNAHVQTKLCLNFSIGILTAHEKWITYLCSDESDCFIKEFLGPLYKFKKPSAGKSDYDSPRLERSITLDRAPLDRKTDASDEEISSILINVLNIVAYASEDGEGQEQVTLRLQELRELFGNCIEIYLEMTQRASSTLQSRNCTDMLATIIMYLTRDNLDYMSEESLQHLMEATLQAETSHVARCLISSLWTMLTTPHLRKAFEKVIVQKAAAEKVVDSVDKESAEDDQPQDGDAALAQTDTEEAKGDLEEELFEDEIQDEPAELEMLNGVFDYLCQCAEHWKITKSLNPILHKHDEAIVEFYVFWTGIVWIFFDSYSIKEQMPNMLMSLSRGLLEEEENGGGNECDTNWGIDFSKGKHVPQELSQSFANALEHLKSLISLPDNQGCDHTRSVALDLVSVITASVSNEFLGSVDFLFGKDLSFESRLLEVAANNDEQVQLRVRSMSILLRVYDSYCYDKPTESVKGIVNALCDQLRCRDVRLQKCGANGLAFLIFKSRTLDDGPRINVPAIAHVNRIEGRVWDLVVKFFEELKGETCKAFADGEDDDVSPPELLFCFLRCALNLSVHPPNQVTMAFRPGLQMLFDTYATLKESDSSVSLNVDPMVPGMLAALLHNLSVHPKNRTCFYKIELKSTTRECLTFKKKVRGDKFSKTENRIRSATQRTKAPTTRNPKKKLPNSASARFVDWMQETFPVEVNQKDRARTRLSSGFDDDPPQLQSTFNRDRPGTTPAANLQSAMSRPMRRLLGHPIDPHVSGEAYPWHPNISEYKEEKETVHLPDAADRMLSIECPENMSEVCKTANSLRQRPHTAYSQDFERYKSEHSLVAFSDVNSFSSTSVDKRSLGRSTSQVLSLDQMTGSATYAEFSNIRIENHIPHGIEAAPVTLRLRTADEEVARFTPNPNRTMKGTTSHLDGRSREQVKSDNSNDEKIRLKVAVKPMTDSQKKVSMSFASSFDTTYSDDPEEFARRVRDNLRGKSQDALSDDMRSKLAIWEHVDGSRVYETLFPKFNLPNGGGAYYFYCAGKIIDVLHVGLEPPPTLPDGKDLTDLVADNRNHSMKNLFCSIELLNQILRFKPYCPQPYLAPNAPMSAEDHEFFDKFGANFGTLLVENRIDGSLSSLLLNDSVEEKVSDWNLNRSIFAPRPKDSACGSFFDTQRFFGRQLRCEFTQLFEKENFCRFLKREVIAKAPGGVGSIEDMSPKLFNFFKTKWEGIGSMFNYYCVKGNDPFQMSLNAFTIFTDDAKLVDHHNSVFNRIQMDDVFQLINISSGPKPKTRDALAQNLSNRVTYHEFIESMIRIATTLYISGKHLAPDQRAPNIVAALEVLYDKFLIPNLPEEVWTVRNDFRQNHLYGEEVDKVLKQHKQFIWILFDRYRLEVKGKRSRRMYVDSGFGQLLRDCDLICENFPRREAVLIALNSKMGVINAQTHWERHTTINVYDFMEALCRMADFLNMPSHAEISQTKFKNVYEVYQGIEIYGYRYWLGANYVGSDADSEKVNLSFKSRQMHQHPLALRLTMFLELISRCIHMREIGSSYDWEPKEVIRVLKQIESNFVKV